MSESAHDRFQVFRRRAGRIRHANDDVTAFARGDAVRQTEDEAIAVDHGLVVHHVLANRGHADRLYFGADITLDPGARFRDIGERDVATTGLRHKARHEFSRRFLDGMHVMIVGQRLVDDQQVDLFLVRDRQVGKRQQTAGGIPEVEIQFGFCPGHDGRWEVKLQTPRGAGGGESP